MCWLCCVWFCFIFFKLKQYRSVKVNVPMASPVPGNSNGPQRCFACKCKVGLTAVRCRCGNHFCSLHRYAEEHACPYDYKAAGAATLTTALPVVVANKIDKF
jgi:hypothetical protein